MKAYQEEIETIHAVLKGGLTPNACEVIEGLEVDMFTNHFNKACWTKIRSLYQTGDLIEPISVYESADKENGFDIFCDQRKKIVGSPANIKGYAKRVRQAYFLNQSYVALENALDAVKNCTESRMIGEAASKVEDALKGLVIETDTKKPRSIDQVMDSYLDVLSKRLEGHESQRMVKIGIDSFDAMTGGFNPTDLVLVAGCPGMGKTEFVLTMMRRMGEGSLLFSMEMAEVQIAERMIAGHGGMPISSLRNAEMSDRDLNMLTTSIAGLKGKGVYVQDQGGLTIEQICSQARVHKANHPDCKLIGVDYLGLVNMGKFKRENITGAYGETAEKLKNLAKEINCTVVLLAQVVSKQVESRPLKDRIPRASEIKNSSEVQDHADWIIYPHRQHVYDDKAPAFAEIVLAKARHGVQGARCYMQFKDGHFVDCDQAYADSMMRDYYGNGSSGNYDDMGGMYG